MNAIEFKKTYDTVFCKIDDIWNCTSGRIRVTDPGYHPPKKKRAI